MRVVFVMKDLCHRCGEVLCSCLLAGSMLIAGLGHTMPHVVLAPNPGEPPHTEQEMDTRQLREPPNRSVATTSTTVFRMPFRGGLGPSGFDPDAVG
jgi:hypothetical protein